MKKSQLGFIQFVKKYIESELNIKLPNFGFLAGQSIAELYFQYYNIDIKTRINDIDLFILYSNKNDDINTKNNQFLKKHININIKNLTNWHINKVNYEPTIKKMIIKKPSLVEDIINKNELVNY